MLSFVAMAIALPALAQSVNPRQVADLEARILALEEQIRDLIGRVEEAEFRSAETSQRLERLLADVDARLQGVEPGPADAAPESASETLARSSADPGFTGSTAAAGTVRRGADPGVLGTISRDALLGLPEPPPEPPPADVAGSPRERFDAGMARLKAGDWSGAEAAFASVVASAPDDPVAPNAAYWQAETYYARKEWPQAAASFARNVRTYGAEAARSPDNVLKLGMALSRMGDRDKACAAFSEFDRRYTNATAALKQMASREKVNAGCVS
ncbi:MAG TPA: tetratricopeptide repeat protein [Geminicoccus sp.]|uniref:tetratricopeptide repeat protein n=1 Tax=Geminicoccus sp. TaxID=2024832 RepID=UPI002E3183DE|nr:tetratricopeptide repeat protein [Geminicoccus sp.]HEX2528095.1 tetratricopeptide repeat protein [Geminicoccus sp.]